ncbi:GTA-gp10 family protein [Rhizobium sp. Rhizsp82]|uniref:GTA-gp10 family protein n=1 Tax=Rhizobium sp. Rhizsp82 TaxID=3243057 RepID=UPI0039B6668C
MIITHDLAGAPRAFRMTIGAYFEIDRQAEGGVAAAFARFDDRSFTVHDLSVSVAALMVGAGMPAEQARSIRLRLSESELAAAICLAAIDAAASQEEDDEPAGKGEPLTQAGLYANAFALGIRPADVDKMTFAEFECCVKGWARMNGQEDEIEAPSAGELDDLVARYG